MLHCARNSLNLSKASQFGSSLAARRPLEGLCIGSSLRAWIRGALAFGSGVPFRVPRRHVVVFSVQMRKIFPFGVPRGVLAIHSAPSMLSLICKSPGRALQALGERGLTPLGPAPNRNILCISARFSTRWPEAGVAFMLLTNYPTFCQQKSEVLFALGFLSAALLEENLALSP